MFDFNAAAIGDCDVPYPVERDTRKVFGDDPASVEESMKV